MRDGKQGKYPDFGADRGIGLRAVAAAVRYQGDSKKNTDSGRNLQMTAGDASLSRQPPDAKKPDEQAG
jgi:hypothetical protein